MFRLENPEAVLLDQMGPSQGLHRLETPEEESQDLLLSRKIEEVLTLENRRQKTTKRECGFVKVKK